MGRDLRHGSAGVYHIVNRGVGLREVYLCTEDKLFFIQLICMYASEYQYTIHTYTLINNGYNFIIETKKDNLSKIMKLINARYTFYFNKKYGRRGYLWEGRFKSWEIKNDNILLKIVAYIEHLSVYTGVSKTKEDAYYASYRQFVGLDQRLSCIEESIIFKRFNNVTKIKNFFNKKIDIDDINNLHEKLKKQNHMKEAPPSLVLPELVHSDFRGLEKDERNNKIYLLYKSGYTQTAIGIALGISQQAVHSIIKKMMP